MSNQPPLLVMVREALDFTLFLRSNPELPRLEIRRISELDDIKGYAHTTLIILGHPPESDYILEYARLHDIRAVHPSGGQWKLQAPQGVLCGPTDHEEDL